MIDIVPRRITKLSDAGSLFAGSNVRYVLLAGLFALVLGMHFYSLVRVPAVWVDEPANASRALGFLQTGRTFGSLDAGVIDKFDGYWTIFPWLGTVIQAAGVWAFGANLFSLRLVSLLFGVVLLATIYVIGRCLYSWKVGVLAALLVSLSLSFLWTAHVGRHDIIVAAFGFGAVALYLTDHGSRFLGKSLLSGLLLGLALDIHYNIAIYIPVVAGLFLLDHGWRVIREARFWGFVAGLGCGVLFFVFMHLVRYPGTYQAIYTIANGSSRNPALFTVDLDTWRSAVGAAVASIDLLRLPVVGAAYVVLLLRSRRNHADRRALLILSALFIGMAAVITWRNYYAILLTPAADLLVAAFLLQLPIPRKLGSPSSVLAFVPGVLCIALVGSSAILSLNLMTGDQNSEYQGILARLHRNIPSGTSVMASGYYWYGFRDDKYRVPIQLAYYEKSAPNATLADAFSALRPDYFVLGDDMNLYVTDDPDLLSSSKFGAYISRSELETFLSKHARMLDQFHTDTYGEIRVFKMDWASAGPAGPPK